MPYMISSIYKEEVDMFGSILNRTLRPCIYLAIFLPSLGKVEYKVVVNIYNKV